MSNNLPSPTVAVSTAITVRGLNPEIKARLRRQAARNARSMESEARAILEAALAAPVEDAVDLATFARSLFAPLGGAELTLPLREISREPPDFTADGIETPAIAALTAAAKRRR